MLAGGHCIAGRPSAKYGLAGHRLRGPPPPTLLTDSAARPGDVLVLTKALGVGVHLHRRSRVGASLPPADAVDAAVSRSMTTLNKGCAGRDESQP